MTDDIVKTDGLDDAFGKLAQTQIDLRSIWGRLDEMGDRCRDLEKTMQQINKSNAEMLARLEKNQRTIFDENMSTIELLTESVLKRIESGEAKLRGEADKLANMVAVEVAAGKAQTCKVLDVYEELAAAQFRIALVSLDTFFAQGG